MLKGAIRQHFWQNPFEQVDVLMCEASGKAPQ
jgi:hypothetical protein